MSFRAGFKDFSSLRSLRLRSGQAVEMTLVATNCVNPIHSNGFGKQGSSAMNEKEWVRLIIGLITEKLAYLNPKLKVEAGVKLSYANEILSYGKKSLKTHHMAYETDMLISESLSADEWQPRVVIEVKINTVTTHDAITYSQKALTHKNVHPYLRYGIFLGNRQHYPLPGRLFRHGAYFDFIRTYAVDRLNVISSDGRSEKSLQSQLANTGFRDFSSLTCPTAGAGRSSK
jgi:hypothetical protein